MELLDKLEQVEIKADSRLPEDDLMFCETQQQAYDESCRALREIRQQWKKAIQAQRDLLGIEQDGSLPYFGSNYRFGITDLNRELEKFHSRFISELTQHFNEKYSVTISTDAIKEHLIPAEPDPYRCDMDTSKEYHRNLRALSLHYEDVVDQMFIQLDGLSFVERAFQELRTKCHTGSWAEEIVAIGVRHTVVLDAYAAALREAFPNRPLFIVTGATTTFAKRRALRQTLRESGNGILLCTQQSLPSSVNFEFVNKVIIPELHYNNSRMSQFYMRFIRFNSVDWKDIYFLTYAQSIESNLMQMILAKEKLNLFMKGDEADMDDIYERFGVDYDLTSLLLYRDIDEDGRFSIRWCEQEIA